jgi:hypothetical protein
MRPSRFQYFAAQWILPLWFGGWTTVGVTYGVLIALAVLRATIEGALHPLWVLMVLATPILAGALGFFGGVFFGVIVLPLVCSWRSTINGAPFFYGDHVRILRGSRRDEIHEVYNVWHERREVRVRLGAEAEKTCTDVFSYLEVCREKK